MRAARPFASAAASARRLSTTAGPFDATFSAMKQRPAKVIPDYLTPMPSHLLTTTLNDLIPPAALSPLPSSPVAAAAALPQGHHLVYFPIQLPPSRLVPDGTDPDHSPGPPFARRMWAGGEVVFRPGWHRGLLLDGRPGLCVEDIVDARSRGPAGEEKVFVDVRRRYNDGHEQPESWFIEERRTLVFMRDHVPSPNPAPVASPRVIKPPHKPDFSVSLTPSSIHLANFSALTYNAHAIHLDRDYTRRVEGHRSLLVHGPLTLALVLRVLAARAGPVASISYRNLTPLYADEPLSVCVRKGGEGTAAGTQNWDAWVVNADGGLAVKANAVVGHLQDA
jgi:hydroxyacyl-ACP dehydratase HTD2-like protein with hotdog domain